MYPMAGADPEGNVHIPFTSTQADIPFPRWQMVTTKIFNSDEPIVIQSVIITNRGEVFLQYAKEINDENEYPKESAVNYGYTPLSERDEKRSYD
jgi:hypothetical protein